MTQVSCPQVECVDKIVAKYVTQVQERVVEVPQTLVEERLVEVPQVQILEAIREELQPIYREEVKEIPKVMVNYVEKVEEVNHLVSSESTTLRPRSRSPPTAVEGPCGLRRHDHRAGALGGAARPRELSPLERLRG